MTVAVRLTPYGPPAFEALCEVIEASRAEQGHILAPATVLVPTGQVGIGTRRALARRGIIGVECLTLGQFAETLAGAAMAAEGRRAESAAVLAGAVRQALQTPAGGIFSPVREHAATEQALLEAHRELRDLGDGDLAALARASRRAHDVVGINRAVRRILAGGGWHDERDLVDAATMLLRRAAPPSEGPPGADAGHRPGGLGGSPDAALEAARRTVERIGHGAVVLYLPQRLGHGALEFLEAVAGAIRRLVVIAGVCGSDAADGSVAAVVRRLGGEDAWQPPAVPSPAPTRVVAVPDADEEVRVALRGVVAGLREGVRLEEMAVLFGRRDPYARLLHDQLAAAGLPYHGSSTRTLAESALGRFLLGLLDLPARRYSRRDVMAWLSSAPVRTETAVAGQVAWRPVPVAAWERISRRAGVLHGAAGWSERLESYREARRLEITRLDEENDWRQAQIEREIALAQDLQRFMADILTRLEVASSHGTWRELAGWARESIGELIGRAAWRADQWPEAELSAAEQVESALDRLGGLDRVDPGPDLARFRQALVIELSGVGMRQNPFGRGLLVGPVRLALGAGLRRVWVLGLAEGVFPGHVVEDSLLSDDDRAATRGALRTASARPHDDYRYYLAALSAASEGRTLLYPEGDLRRTAERLPSRLLLHSVRGLPAAGGSGSAAAGPTGHPAGGVGAGPPGDGGPNGAPAVPPMGAPDLESLPPGVFARVPSTTASLRACAFPATPQEYDLRRLLDRADAGQALSENVGSSIHESLGRSVKMLRHRHSDRFTPFDGNLAGCEIPGPADPGTVVSATALESWAACPHAYFMRYLLGVDPVEDPERELRVSALERGDLIHAVLDRFLKECALAGEPPRPGEAWGEDRRRRLVEVAEAVFGERERQGRVGQPIFWEWERRRIRDELLEFLDRDEGFRREMECRPWASEKRFAMPGRGEGECPEPPVDVVLPDGRELRLRGAVDRIDVTGSGGLVVIDYKTGGSRTYGGLGEPPLLLYAGGSRRRSGEGALPRLQLPIYARAARRAATELGVAARGAPSCDGEPELAPVTAGYWFVTVAEKYRWLSVPITSAVEEEMVWIVGAIADGIAAGVFPANPPAEGTGYCDYCEREPRPEENRRRLRRKAADPALAGWLTVGARHLLPSDADGGVEVAT